MAITAQPKADVIAMQRSQLLEEGIEYKRHKTGKKLLIEWSPALRETIDLALIMHGNAIFPHVFVNSKHDPLTCAGFNTAWGKLQRELVRNGSLQRRFRPHDLRAKAGSDSDNHLLLGHADPRLFQRVYMRIAEHVKPTR